MRDREILILWDASHVWGLLAMRGVAALGFAPRLVKAQDIARKGLQGNGRAPLLVPGGRARAKALALGEAGRRKIREFVAGGGVYLGFCGGAGLALSAQDAETGLGLCPWRRGVYAERILHLISGDLSALVRGAGEAPVSLPVWWPGKFAPAPGAGVDILAECRGAGDDFWLADIPFSAAPGAIRANWRERRGVGLDCLAGQPLVVRGSFGEGAYILSYSHLETPQCPFANAWLAAMLEEICGEPAAARVVPQWSPPAAPGADERPAPQGGVAETAVWLHAKMLSLLHAGEELGIFFPRTPWLLGWRGGFAGLALNSLRLGLASLAQAPECSPAELFWKERREKFMSRAADFFGRAEAAFWNFRLESALSGPSEELAREAAEIFGHPMQGGGLAGELLDVVYELIYRFCKSRGLD